MCLASSPVSRINVPRPSLPDPFVPALTAIRNPYGQIPLLLLKHGKLFPDRKAIISRGHLRCVGSSLFLKNKFGIGYHLG